jgi:Spy/CpxP family protein refolding chaperone
MRNTTKKLFRTPAALLLAAPLLAAGSASAYEAPLLPEPSPAPSAAFDLDEASAGPDLFAQKRGKRGKGKGLRGGRLSPDERAKLKAEVQRKMQTFITVELASQLGLDDKRALKLSAAIKKHHEQADAHHAKMRAEMEALKSLLESGSASDKALNAQAKKVLKLRDGRPEMEDIFADTKSFLSAKERAKLILVFPHVQQEMRKMMRHARREMRGGHGGPGGPGGHGPHGGFGGRGGPPEPPPPPLHEDL